jgi:hypothetical protein
MTLRTSMRRNDLRPRVWLSLFAWGVCIGCDSSHRVSAGPRSALRTEALGCWALTPASGDNLTPRFVRLDTSRARTADVPGLRALKRLDSFGDEVLRDEEGFEPIDDWSADSTSDDIRLLFNNGLYGSTWRLTLPAGRSGVNMIRGTSQGFGDVDPPPDYPLRPVRATRIPCKQAVEQAGLAWRNDVHSVLSAPAYR